MPTHPLGLPKAPRTDRYVGHLCAVDGCKRETRAMSRWCTLHARIHYRTRHPEGRMLLRAELRPWRDLAAFALDQWGFGTHPAVRAAERQLEALIAMPGNMPAKYARHFLRLDAAGVNGRKMLLRIMAVYGIRYLGHPGSMQHGDPVFWANLGSYFLRSAPVGNKPAHWYTGKGADQFRLSGMVCHDVGCALAEKVGALCIQLWNAIEAERTRREAAELEIRDALERCPL